jgi:molybdopterin-guanine dinucleotide biosynthesis protein A
MICEECKQSYNINKVVVWQDRVLCHRCAITLVIHILDNVNTKLREINERLRTIIRRLNYEYANR